LTQPIIKLKNLSKSYGDAVIALSDVSLEVEENSIFGFLGPNGAGKSTTIKILLGLTRPTSGSATIFGHDIRRDSLAIRSKIGYLPQYPHFYDHMTAREVLDFSMKFYFSGPQPLLDDRINLLLDLVSLSNKADRDVKGYSGGERQRLGIAQAMVNFPDLLVLDEPASALDPIGRKDVLEIMEKLKEYTTIFYSTHILDDVERTSDTVAILNHGELIAQGPIETLLESTDGILYSVSLSTEGGDLTPTREKLLTYDWIGSIDQGKNGDWTVKVTDEEMAERYLLRKLLEDEQIRVNQYSRVKYDLEDVFMRVVAD